MKLRLLPAMVSLGLGFVAPARSGEPALSVPAEPLVSLQSPAGWSLGARWQGDSREFDVGDEALDMDMNHALAQVGYSVLPSLHLRGELGWARAEQDFEDGEGGLEWAVGAVANLVEFVLESSPVVGKQQTIGLGFELFYREVESNFDEADFEYGEVTAAPVFTYARNRRGDVVWRPYQPEGVLVQAGVQFSSIDGDYGDEGVAENRDFGFLAGAGMQWENGWVTQFRAVLYGAHDRSLGLGVAYNF